MNRIQKISACAGGPIISLLIAIFYTFVGVSMRTSLIGQISILAACIHFYQFIITAIPIKYPKFWGAYAGCRSYGYNVLLLIKGI